VTRTRMIAGMHNAIQRTVRAPRFASRPPDHAGLPYRERRRSALVDVYLPGEPGPPSGHPSALVLHGGAFLSGSRRDPAPRSVAARLAAAGIAVGSADYPLLFRGGSLEAQRDDVATLRRFWRERSGDWGLDPERCSIVGLSAGGTLALLDAARADYHRVVTVYGLYDLAAVNGPGTRLWRTLLTKSASSGAWAEASPMAVAGDVEAPLLMVHGTEDDLVRYEQAERLRDARARAMRETRLLTLDGERHGWMQDPSQPASRSTIDAIVAFLLDAAPPGGRATAP